MTDLIYEVFEFTVFGNQEDEKGNPLGYHRTTQKSKWNDASQRYEAWKEHVRSAFYKKYTGDDALENIPLSTSRERIAKMDVDIYFANDVRADVDNVWKGIADALFKNDKYVLCGSFEGKVSNEKVGWVNIKIKIQKNNGKEKR